MPANVYKKIVIVLVLGLLTVSAFFIRLENFKNSRLRSIDEIVYYRMARQILDEGLSGYNTISYGQELAASGRPLPEYFFQPLFKHPPLFTFLIALSMKVFGANLVSAGYVSLLFGVLLIPLTYLLGMVLFNSRIGTCAALFMWIDPVSVICSQKVWMDTTVAFYGLLAILAFVAALRSGKGSNYLLFGIFCGFATSTKFTGILPLIAAVLYGACYQKTLFRDRYYLFGLMIPVLFFMPWAVWNFAVYGPGWISQFATKIHPHILEIFRPVNPAMGFAALVVVLAGMRLTYKLRENSDDNREDKIQTGCLWRRENLAGILICAAICILFFKQIANSFRYDVFPGTSWGNFGFREDHSPFFYFQQLINFFPIYIFSFFALFLRKQNDSVAVIFIRLTAIIILSFFIIWGNYQSRYIMPVIPVLVILAVHQVLQFSRQCSLMTRFFPRVMLKAMLILFVANSLMKVFFVNSALSFPHDFCYF